MLSSNNTESGKVSAESLADLNDELAAMIRTGMPLDEGLRSAARYLRKDSHSFVERLRIKIEQGSTLEEAIEAESVLLPVTYISLIKAGWRMGRLPEALTAFTSFARARVELRQEIGTALLYPAFILLMAFLLSIFVCFMIFPQLVSLHRMFDLQNTPLMNSISRLFEYYQTWYLLIPLVFVFLIICWRLSRHAFLLPQEQHNSLSGQFFAYVAYGWIPGYRKLIRDMNCSTFSEMAGILLAYQVPLPETLSLAAESTGSRKLMDQFHAVSRQLIQGESLGVSLQSCSQLPEYMKSMMVNPAHQNHLSGIMSEMARVYRTRVSNRIDWIKRIIPIALLLVVGGGITACYTILVFIPFVEILKMLGSPSL